MKTYTSQATRRAAAAQNAKLQVMEIVGIDELTYGLLQFETGIAYLSVLLCDPCYEQMLQRSRMFWNWWKNHWLLRDEQFLQAAKHSDWRVNKRGKRGKLEFDMEYEGYPWCYKYFHNPVDLVSEIHPNGIVLQESYAAMIGQIMDLKR